MRKQTRFIDKNTPCICNHFKYIVLMSVCCLVLTFGLSGTEGLCPFLVRAGELPGESEGEGYRCSGEGVDGGESWGGGGGAE